MFEVCDQNTLVVPEVPSITEYIYITNPRNPEIVSRYGLGELVVGGYNVAGMDAVEEQLDIEYGDATGAFLALDQNGKAKGSLALKEITIEDDPSFVTFIDCVDKVFPDKKGRPVLHINGIVVDQSHRNKGLGNAMMKKAIGSMNPSLIVGETKTPEAVAIRAKLGQSFYGFQPVGTASEPNAEIRGLIEIYVDADKELLGDLWQGKDEDYYENGVFFVDSNYLPNNVPMPRPKFYEVFKQVISIQERENDNGMNRTAVAPIITIIE